MKYEDWELYFQGNVSSKFPTLVAEKPMKVYISCAALWTAGYINWHIETPDNKQFKFNFNTKFTSYGAYSPNESFELNKGDKLVCDSVNNGVGGTSEYSIYIARAI